MRIHSGNDKLEVGSFGDYFLNGVAGAALDGATIAGFPVNHTMVNKKVHLFEILLAKDTKEMTVMGYIIVPST